MLPAPQREWPGTLDEAKRQALMGKFAGADSILAKFASEYPGSPEALETSYWRALFALDPTNQRASTATATASLDSYISDTRPRSHLTEAMTLRRVAGQIDSLKRAAAIAMEQARAATAAAANAQAQAASAQSQVANAQAQAANAQAQTSNANARASNANARASNANARASNANARAEAAQPEVNAATTSDAEVKRLRDELAKANSELERIKKKLSQAPPKP